MPKIQELYNDIPDLTGKVAIVTGGNTGIGKVTCRYLLAKGAKVYMGARSKERAEEAIKDIKTITGKSDIHWLPMDLADLNSVQNSAQLFTSQEKELHILINNAGIMAVEFSLTKHGHETQWGTNVVGHFALIRSLLPILLHTASLHPKGTVRVINVTSEGHRGHPKGGINFDDLTLSKFAGGDWRRYSQSKLGNILLTKEIAKRYEESGIISIAVHPGVIKTQLHTNINQTWFNRFLLSFSVFQMISEDEGAYTQIFAATHPKVVTENMNGEYLIPLAKIGKPTSDAKDITLATKLWDYLEKDVSSKL